MAEEKNNTAKINQSKQEKLKNQTESQNKDDELKTKSPAELRKLLSNKNSDYVFRLQKELQAQGKMTLEEAESKVNELLPEIIVAQRPGQPANGLYMASPKIKAMDMLSPKNKKPVVHPFWQRAIDSALLYLVFFVGAFGVLEMFQSSGQKDNPQTGILTLVSVGVLMGIYMAKYNDWVVPGKGQGKTRVSWGKAILGMLGLLIALFIWLWIITLPGIRVINPTLPGVVDIIIAAIAYGIRWLFRRHYDITGSTFAPAPRQK